MSNLTTQETHVVSVTDLQTHAVAVREQATVVIDTTTSTHVASDSQGTQVLDVIHNEHVVVEQPQITIVAAGQQGPAGPPGIDGVGEPFIMPAGPTGVSGHRALMALADGTAAHAEPENAAAYVGISTHAAAPGAPVIIAQRDILAESSWSLVPGLPVFYKSAGLLTQTVPDSVALTRVGLAVSPSSMLMSRDTPIFLLGA